MVEIDVIQRLDEKTIKKDFFKGKIILILGPRQVGKTTMIHNLLKSTNKPYLFLNGDEMDVQEQLTNVSSTALRLLFGSHKLIFIDEVQHIPKIGYTLKIIADTMKDVQIIASGSSALEIADETQEPLTGRKFEYQLYPLSFKEMCQHHGMLDESRLLEQRMIYGYYPEVVKYPQSAERSIKLIANSYLYKDILKLDSIKKPSILNKLLKALALQLGSEVSYNELSRLVQVEYHTVERYIDLLEKAFVIFTLPALSGNERTEIRKGKKIYFYDNGIRNAILGNFSPLSSRSDVGALWENFIINERMKYKKEELNFNRFFWRTVQQQEIDYIESTPEGYLAYEFKWNPEKKGKFSKTFLKNYHTIETEVITPKNYSKFIGLF
jgi:predicted AAA+ superfamily ATPase